MEAVNTLAAEGAAAPGPQRQQQLLLQQQQKQQQDLGSSIFVADDAPVYDMPLSAINRPLLSEVQPEKVCGG
jgi:hypothetical protein